MRRYFLSFLGFFFSFCMFVPLAIRSPPFTVSSDYTHHRAERPTIM